MRILIATDAWLPQTNGVVNTLRQTRDGLVAEGHQVSMVTPLDFRSVPCPGYGEIRLALVDRNRLAGMIEEAMPDAVHIATEGPIGWAARALCRGMGLSFTTSYHTQFPEYLRRRLPVPLAASYALVRRFHSAGTRCMVSTPTLQRLLESRGFNNLVRWQRGVDTTLFRPGDKSFLDLPRPLAVYVGRVAVEKNIEAFLAMPWEGGKLVIGDGPERARLQAQFPDAVFTGYRHGEELVRHLAAADVMVFPSKTDTFGLVNLEAMACGLPVAAYPVTGPIDVIRDGVTGALDEDLAAAARRALTLSPEDCRRYAEGWSWAACTRQFRDNLVPARARQPATMQALAG
ncbi:MAG: hypothetical protein RL026_1286 [Pseudomonadota bacterium]|jgi:glycosyltransferase involved in cell wall biosynthesis